MTFTLGTLFLERRLEQSDVVPLRAWKWYVPYRIGFRDAIDLQQHCIWSHAGVCELSLDYCKSVGVYSTITAVYYILDSLTRSRTRRKLYWRFVPAWYILGQYFKGESCCRCKSFRGRLYSVFSGPLFISSLFTRSKTLEGSVLNFRTTLWNVARL